MAEPVRHRQTKGAATDMFDLQPPRHISTLRNLAVRTRPGEGPESTLCGTRRAQELLRPLPFKLGRMTRIGGLALSEAGLAVHYSAGRPLPALRREWSAPAERTMVSENDSPPRQQHDPWNKGRLIGQKRPLKPRDVRTIRVRLQLEGRKRHLALFNLAIDSKLRG